MRACDNDSPVGNTERDKPRVCTAVRATVPSSLRVLALAMLVIHVFAQSVLAESPFVAETVDASPNFVGVGASLALDSGSIPHIAYLDLGPDRVKYARLDGSQWTLEEISGVSMYLSAEASLAIDSKDDPHVLSIHNENDARSLVYATKTNDAWTIETIEDIWGDNSFGSRSLLLDSSDRPHISHSAIWRDWRCGSHLWLTYRTKIAGTWVSEAIDRREDGSDVGYQASLALDPLGNPHAAYIVGSGFNQLAHAERLGPNSWSWAVVDTQLSAFATETSIAVDPQGNPVIAYFERWSLDLHIARKSGGTWTIENVYSSPNALGPYLSLKLDPFGDPRVSFVDGQTTDLHFAWKLSGGWAVTTVDASPNAVGGYNSLALDDRLSPHIAYYDATAGDLRYARAKRLWTAIPEGLACEATTGLHDGALATAVDRLLVTPNPFGATGTRVAFSARRGTSPVELAVYDLSGRRVASLASGIDPGAAGAVRWDAKDDAGNTVPSGRYVIRLRGSESASMTVTMLR